MITLIFDLIVGLIEGILNVIFDFIMSFFTSVIPSLRKRLYNADFARSGNVLKEKGGFYLGTLSLGESSAKHVICIGGSGSYKTSSIIIPSILNIARQGSMVINNMHGELLPLTSGAVMKSGTIPKVLDLNSFYTEGFNPFSYMQTISDANKFNKVILRNSVGFLDNAFFAISAEHAMGLFSRLQIKYLPDHYRNYYTMLQMVNAFSAEDERIDRLFARSHDVTLLSEYRALVATEGKVLQSILSTVKAALSVFADPGIARLTSYNTFHWDDLRQQRVALYINCNVTDSKFYAPIIALLVESMLTHFMRRIPEPEENAVYLLLEEAGNTFISSMDIAITSLRKYRVPILQVYQHPSQIKELYNEAIARTLIANSFTKCYMGGGQPLDVANELSQMLGAFHYIDDDGILRSRNLMSSDEIRQSEEALIFHGNRPALRERLKPFFEQKRLMRLTELSPYIPENKIPFLEAPILDLDVCLDEMEAYKTV